MSQAGGQAIEGLSDAMDKKNNARAVDVLREVKELSGFSSATST
jgi:hypothetical protein